MRDCWKTPANTNLIDGIEKECMVPVPEPFTQMIAYREWISQCSSGVQLTLGDSYYFTIKLNDAGIACLYGKHGAEQECRESEGVELLTKDLPRNHPEVIRPSDAKVNIKAFKETIERCFKEGSISAMKNASWKKFFDDHDASEEQWKSREQDENVYEKRLKKDGKPYEELRYYKNPDTMSAFDDIPVLDQPNYASEIDENDPGDDWLEAPELDMSIKKQKKRQKEVYEEVLKHLDRTGQFAALHPPDDHLLDPECEYVGWIVEILTPFTKVTDSNGIEDYEFMCHWHTGGLKQSIRPMYEEEKPELQKTGRKRKIDHKKPKVPPKPLTQTVYASNIIVCPLNFRPADETKLTTASYKMIVEQMTELRALAREDEAIVEGIIVRQDLEDDDEEDVAGPS